METYGKLLIKIDLLSVEGMDRIQTCLQLLIDNNMVEDYGSLKENYEHVIGVYNLERDNPKMWKMLCNHEVPALFQMEGQTGISGIEALQPTSVDDLAILNSTIRLMAQNKGDEMPTDKCARFKKNHNDWINETRQFGLTDEHREFLWEILNTSYGLCITQEQFMLLVQRPECGGFSLTWADKLRKAIAKKSPKDYDALTKEFFAVTQEKQCDQNLCHYVWDVLIAMSKGYGFNSSHTLAYSIVGLQELNLAFRFPILFWNCACLITDSGGAELDDIEEIEVNEEGVYEQIIEDFTAPEPVEEVVDIYEEEDQDEYEYVDSPDRKTKVKKKTHTADFGKIATAIGKMSSMGIIVSPPNINHSTYTFSPDVQNNQIRYGLSGITRVGEDLIQDIISNRPYNSLSDFTDRVKVNKLQMINLIKSGAFDEFGDNRIAVMRSYIESIADIKKRITLQNMKMLIDFKLLPATLDLECRIFNFNKYIKKFKYETYYLLNDIALNFYENNFNMDKLYPCDIEDCSFKISQVTWDAIYKKAMDPVRNYIKSNADELLTKMNNKIISDLWDKYCEGNISKWEMDSVSYYSHEHELSKVDLYKYDIVDYFDLPEEPEVERMLPIKGQFIPLFRINRIAGTILDKNKTKKTVTLLTTTGVVTVRIFGDVFSHYDKQISEKGADGKKHVKEKSFLARGNKIIVCGIKRDSMFSAKKYSRTPYHLIELITKINSDGSIETKSERMEVV